MRFAAVLSLLAFLPALASGSSAETVVGDDRAEVRLKNSTIRIAVSRTIDDTAPNVKNGSRIREALFRSILRWESVADIRIVTEYVDRELTASRGNAGDGISLITMSSLPELTQLFSKNGSREAARTRVYYDKRGNIYEADIFLNPFALFSSDGSYGTFDLESVFTHELGHVLGFRHNSVRSSIMFDAISENGPLGPLSPPKRELTAVDIAMARSVYGYAGDDGSCCAAATGRLVFGGKSGKTSVFAEENGTGRLLALTETNGEGAFELGGLSGGVYSLFWLREGAFGTIGTDVALLATGEFRRWAVQAKASQSAYVPPFIGIYGILSESAVTLRRGEQYRLFMGGGNGVIETVKPRIRGPFIVFEDGSRQVEDYGRDVFVVSFVVKVDPDTPPGAYSIEYAYADGTTAVSLGSIWVL